MGARCSRRRAEGAEALAGTPRGHEVHTYDLQVAVVGAGPCGLVAAAALARHGAKVAVFEQRREPKPGRVSNPKRTWPLGLAADGMRALDEIGAKAAVRKYCNEQACFVCCGPSSELFGRWWRVDDRMSLATESIYGAQESYCAGLVEHIRSASAEWPGEVDFFFEAPCTAVDVLTGEVVAGSVSRRFDLVVGADGVNSVVRAAAESQCPDFAVEEVPLSIYAKVLHLDRVNGLLQEGDGYNFCDEPCAHGAIMPGMEGNGLAVFEVPEAPAVSSLEDVEQYLLDASPLLLAMTSREERADFVDRPVWNIGRCIRCSQLYAGRMALVGDAACAYPPCGAGLTLGMETAVELGRAVAEAGGSVPRALPLFSSRRQPALNAVFDSSVEKGVAKGKLKGTGKGKDKEKQKEKGKGKDKGKEKGKDKDKDKDKERGKGKEGKGIDAGKCGNFYSSILPEVRIVDLRRALAEQASVGEAPQKPGRWRRQASPDESPPREHRQNSKSSADARCEFSDGHESMAAQAFQMLLGDRGAEFDVLRPDLDSTVSADAVSLALQSCGLDVGEDEYRELIPPWPKPLVTYREFRLLMRHVVLSGREHPFSSQTSW